MRLASFARTGLRSMYAMAAISASSVKQRARVEALLEEVPGAVVLEVGAAGDGLLEVLHEAID